MAFWDAVVYLLFPRCPAERARSLRRRAKDVRNNGRGPRAGEIEQWDRWDKTRPSHKRGKGAFVPEDFVTRDVKRMSTDAAEKDNRGGRSGRERYKKKAMPRSERRATPNAKAHQTPSGVKAQSPTPKEARDGGGQIEAWSGGALSTVNVGHWQQSQGRWPFTGIR